MGNGKWISSQIGSREHYAIPKVLKRLNKLQKFYTDIWIPPLFNKGLGMMGSSGKALKGRFDSEIGKTGNSIGNLNSILKQTLFKEKDNYKSYCSYGAYFATRINSFLKKELNNFDFYFTYNTGALETFRFLKSEGKTLVLDQIDPGRPEKEIVELENEKFPGWALDQYHKAPDYYYERIEREWELADMIIVNSEWSKKSLISQGVHPDKLRILPLCYEAIIPKGQVQKLPRKSFKVLFAANVILRKGIQYLIESARQLKEYDIQFIVAGPINISNHIIKEAPGNMNFLGKIERQDLAAYYMDADVYVLPTLSDGFAITQIEAMAYGLPVITTDRCGDVVTNHIDGIIIPPYSSDDLSRSILTFYNNRELLHDYSLNALQKAESFNFKNFTERVELSLIMKSL